MELLEVTNLNKEIFQKFLAAYHGSFEQTWTWGQWFTENAKTPLRYMVMGDTNEPLLLAQGFFNSLSPLPGRFLHFPYGPVANPALSTQATTAVVRFFTSQLQKTGTFLRLEPKQNLRLADIGTKSLNTLPSKTIINDLQKTPEQLLEAMHPKTRYNIRIASRHGVRVTHSMVANANSETIEAAALLILTTQARQKYRGHSKQYLVKLLNFFKNNQEELTLSIYQAFLGEKQLACAVMCDFDTARTYIFGGSSDENKNLMAPYLLHWQAMQDAKTKGLSVYDFGGFETTSGDNPGFTRFKSGFGGTLIEFPGAWDIVSKPLIYNLYKPLRALNRKLKHRST